MDKVEEFINEEETLKAMKAARKSHGKSEEKKRNEFKRIEDEPRTTKMRFNDYDFIPLDASISKVLMKIKKYPKFWRPLRILGVSPPQK